jgi:transcription antitermination factor NusG
MQAEGLRWLVVETHHREETIAEEHCAEQGFPTFLPLRRMKDGSLSLMFEGYLMVRADVGHDAGWEALTRTEGIASVLRSAGSQHPWCIPVRQWEALRDLAGPLKVFDPWPRPKRQTHTYRKGDMVRIVSGLMADPYGVVERIGTVDWTEKDSIRVIGDCFGAISGVTVPAAQVELVSPGSAGPDDRLPVNPPLRLSVGGRSRRFN